MNTMIPAWVEGTLTPVEKLEVHKKGLRHKAVSVFVMRGDRILLQQRALSKYHTPGLWANTCCTHPHWDEQPLTCAQRRLEEELGITGLPLTFRERVEYRAVVGNGLIEHEVADIFVGNAGPELEPVANPAEVMDTVWMSLNDLLAEIQRDPTIYTPWLKIYLSDHSAKIFGDA
jgi:isopentenyl-diphosphate delta-isomerase